MGVPLRNIKPTDREARLMLQLLKLERYENYRRDPLLWAKDVLGENPENFEWSLHGGAYKNHVWDGDENPLSTAWRALARKQWVGVAAATGTSKTYWLSRVMLWFLDCFEDALVITTAPKQDQLSLNLWGEVSKIVDQFAKTRPYTRVTSLRLQPEGFNNNYKYKDTHHAIGFVAGVVAGEEVATKAAGFHRKNMLIICEEMPGMSSAIFEAFQNTSVGSNNLMLGVGNPDSETDELYKFCQLPNVRSLRISAYDYPNVVLGKEIYHGAVSQASIDRRKAKYLSESHPLYLSRVRGITPSGSEHSLIKGSWIDMCNKHHPNFKGYKNYNETGERLMVSYNAVGVDVANSEDGDKACLAWGQGQFLIDVHEFQCPNAMHLAYNIIQSDDILFDKNRTIYNTRKIQDLNIMPQCIGVDTVGVGVSTLNTLLEENYEATSLSGGPWTEDGIIPHDAQGKPMYSFQGLRSQMIWELAVDIQNGNIVFDIEDAEVMARLKKELVTPKFLLSSGVVAIEKKEHIIKRIGKSPNMLDSVAYWNWVRKGYRLSVGVMPMVYG